MLYLTLLKHTETGSSDVLLAKLKYSERSREYPAAQARPIQKGNYEAIFNWTCDLCNAPQVVRQTREITTEDFLLIETPKIPEGWVIVRGWLICDGDSQAHTEARD